MEISVFQGGYDKNLCYLIWCKESKRAAIIDPSVEPLTIFDKINVENLILEKIIITQAIIIVKINNDIFIFIL